MRAWILLLFLCGCATPQSQPTPAGPALVLPPSPGGYNPIPKLPNVKDALFRAAKLTAPAQRKLRLLWVYPGVDTQDSVMEIWHSTNSPSGLWLWKTNVPVLGPYDFTPLPAGAEFFLIRASNTVVHAVGPWG